MISRMCRRQQQMWQGRNSTGKWTKNLVFTQCYSHCIWPPGHSSSMSNHLL